MGKMESVVSTKGATTPWSSLNWICSQQMLHMNLYYDTVNYNTVFGYNWLGLLSGVGGRVGPVWRIKQAPEEVQGGKD